MTMNKEARSHDGIAIRKAETSSTGTRPGIRTPLRQVRLSGSRVTIA